MKELFPLNTFQQDAVLKRLEELREAVEDVDDKMPYDEDTDTFSLDGDLSVTGDAKLFENIVDSQGHKRFIEGVINVVEQTGVVINYAKWSLSGTHLLIVVAGTINAGNTCSLSASNTSNDIPQWIKDKIYPLGGSDNVAYSVVKNINAQTSYIQSDINIILIKNGNSIMFYHETPFGSNNNPVSFRTQFDLLIDNEEPVNP